MLKKEIYGTIFSYIMVTINNINRITAINITEYNGEKHLKIDNEEPILCRLWDIVDAMGGKLKCCRDKNDMYTTIKMTVEKDMVFEKTANRYGIKEV